MNCEFCGCPNTVMEETTINGNGFKANWWRCPECSEETEEPVEVHMTHEDVTQALVDAHTRDGHLLPPFSDN